MSDNISDQRSDKKPDETEWSMERRIEQGHRGLSEGIYRDRLEWADYLEKQAQEARAKGEVERAEKLEAGAREYRSWKPDHLG